MRRAKKYSPTIFVSILNVIFCMVFKRFQCEKDEVMKNKEGSVHIIFGVRGRSIPKKVSA